MQREKNIKSIGLGYLIASFVFLFNPNISVIDVLPDFIGFFLLSAGLTKIADIMPRFTEVKEKFSRLAWISIAKLLSIILIFVMPYNEQATFGLVLTFSFAIIDLIVLIPAWNGFFEGIIYLGTRHDGESVFYKRKIYGKTLTEKLKNFTIVFFVLKEIFVIMPELTSLSNSNYGSLGYVETYVVDINHFQPHFRVLASIVIIILGIVWLCRMISFVRRLQKDTPFISKLIDIYRREVLPNTDLFTRRRIKAALVTLCFAFGLGVDFYVYDVNLIPEIISAVLFVCGFALLYRYLKISKLAVFAGAVYGIVSLLNWLYSMYFANNFDITHIDKDYDVYHAYSYICIGAVIESAFYIAFIVCVFYVLLSLVKEHTGYVSENTSSAYARRYGEEEKRLLKKGLVEGVVIAVLSAFSNIAYHVLVINVEFIWMINLAVAAVCAVMWVSRLNNIYEQVEDKYVK